MSEAEHFDAMRKYVRVCSRRPDGFVEFEFAIGEPELCVELMLPESTFHEFCIAHEVIVLEPIESASAGDWVKRMNDATQKKLDEAT